MPISPTITLSSSPTTQRTSDEGRSRDSSSADAEGQVRTPTRFQGGPLQLLGRSPRSRPPSGVANSQQANASADSDHPAEQHVRTGTQLLSVAGGHHEVGQVGSGQIGAAAQGAQNASAANRAHAAGAAEAAASLTMDGQIQIGSLAMQRPLSRLQQASYESANRRLEDFSQSKMAAQTINALQAQLVNVDMSRFKGMQGAMTPDIGIMYECIRLATESNSIIPNEARLTKCHMGMAEAANVLNNCVRHVNKDIGEPMITQTYADELNQVIGMRHRELTQGMTLSSPADISDESLAKLENEFGKGGNHIVLWAGEQHENNTQPVSIADRVQRDVKAFGGDGVIGPS
jgi:hypothetical protein